MEIALTLIASASVIVMAVCLAIAFRERSSGRTARILLEEQKKIFEQQISQLKADSERREKDSEQRMLEISRQAAIAFENIANKALKEQGEELRNLNREQVDTLLTPLKTRIEDFTRQAAQSHTEQTAARKSLSDQIERLMALNSSIGEEARNLTHALRRNTKAQGDWGEKILQQILEDAGLKEGIHFSTQVSRDNGGKALTDEDGHYRRPDFLIHLPGERVVIIDSKVSLSAFSDYIEAEEEDKKKEAIRRLIKSVRSHIDELGNKNYQKIVRNSAEQVLMFMPVEGAYFLAMDNDRSLSTYALRQKVVIVTPTHLFSVIQLIDQMWRRDKQDRNAAEIARLGGLIYDRMASFARDFTVIADNINKTKDAYDKCLSDISGGSQSVIARTLKMKELGAKTSKPFPEQFLE